MSNVPPLPALNTSNHGKVADREGDSGFSAPNLLSTASRRPFRLDATLLLAGTGSLLAFALPVPQRGAIAGLPSLCPLHTLTGIPCPGCGLTRSVVCCAHGLWHQSVLYHPLGPLALAGMLGLAVWRLGVWRGAVQGTVPPRLQTRAAVLMMGLLLVTWVVRMAGLWPLPP